MKYTGKFVKNKCSLLVIYTGSKHSVDYAQRWEEKNIAIKIFQKYMYWLCYKENGLVESPKFARGFAGFR
jgi:hypothetical protein